MDYRESRSYVSIAKWWKLLDVILASMAAAAVHSGAKTAFYSHKVILLG